MADERAAEQSRTEPDRPLLDGAWAGLETDLATERSAAGSLRRRSLTARLSIALGAAVAVPLIALTIAPRADLAEVFSARGALFAATALLIAVASAWLAARPLQARALPRQAILGLAVATCGAALLFALWPLGVDLASDLEGHAFHRCGAASLAVGAMVFAVAHTIRRDASGSVVGAGALGGVAALVTLTLVCSVDELVHLLAGHAAPVALLVGLALAAHLRPPRSVPEASEDARGPSSGSAG